MGSVEESGTTDGLKELRIALVCYGGVSLAIYMHGLTQELHRLAIASNLAKQDLPEGSTEATYRKLLDDLADEDARTQVVIDIVSGTSAGGINGVSLARALACDGVLTPVRRLWMQHADIEQLLRPEWSKVLADAKPAVESVMGLMAKRFPALANVHLPVGGDLQARHGWVHRLAVAWDVLHEGEDIREFWHTPSALKGEMLAYLIGDGLRGITRDAPGTGQLETLMPPGQQLDLFVTMTDLNGYVQHVPLGTVYVSEHGYRHHTRFTRRADAGASHDFDDDHVDILGFSGRASSSFPGAFEPISLDRYAEALAGGDPSLDVVWPASLASFFRRYELQWDEIAVVRPESNVLAHIKQRTYVDGGVLDNYPFDHAVTAIRARPAEREVRRVLIYVEPDPMRRPAREDTIAHDDRSVASMLSAVKAAGSDIPREEPILEQVRDLEAKSEAARRLRRLIAATPPPEGNAGTNDPNDVAYLGLRIDRVAADLAGAICAIQDFPKDSNQATATHLIVQDWMDTHVPLNDEDTPADPTAAARGFLATFDLGYQRRRLRFLVDVVIGLYKRLSPHGSGDGEPGPTPTRQQLDDAKQALYHGIAGFDRAYGQTVADDDIRSKVEHLFPDTISSTILGPPDWPPKAPVKKDEIASRGADVQRLVAAVTKRLVEGLDGKDFEAHAREVYEHLVKTVKEDWGDAAWVAERFETRFESFAHWDRMLFPVMQAYGVGEYDTVEIARMSPLDTSLLAPRDSDAAREKFYEDKLKGTAVSHFGAFFEPAWRENDYLWGRLDGAERLVRLLVGPDKEATIKRYCRELFGAILDDESSGDERLAHIDATFDKLRTDVSGIT
jgi:predicted acylesterase/phospholipase RssA